MVRDRGSSELSFKLRTKLNPVLSLKLDSELSLKLDSVLSLKLDSVLSLKLNPGLNAKPSSGRAPKRSSTSDSGEFFFFIPNMHFVHVFGVRLKSFQSREHFSLFDKCVGI